MTRAVFGAALAVAFVLAGAGCDSPRPGSPPSPAPLAPAVAAPPTAAGDDFLADEAPSASQPSRETVTIKLVADARRQAHVYWGRKDLGVAPVEITRPRGSGPLDLLVLAPGALPLHTRAFTDRNETLALRIYGEKEASGLVGWTRADLPRNPRTGIEPPAMRSVEQSSTSRDAKPAPPAAAERKPRR